MDLQRLLFLITQSESILVLVSNSQWLAPCTGLSLADVHVWPPLTTFYLIVQIRGKIYDCFSCMVQAKAKKV